MYSSKDIDLQHRFYDLYREISNSIKNTKHNLTIFSPYMKMSALQKITEGINQNVQICLYINFNIKNYLFGSVDLEVLEFALNNPNIFLYINNNLHMKAYIYDYKSFHSGSANCTSNGLGLSPNSNFEILTFSNCVSEDYLMFCQRIHSRSKILNKELLEMIKKLISEVSIDRIKLSELDKLDKTFEKELNSMRQILASHMPLVAEVRELFDYLEGEDVKSPEQNIKHDLNVFGMLEKPYSSYKVFLRDLSVNFFNHDFVKLIFENMGESINFGGVRRLLEKECIDDPRPTRDEINVLINNIYNWLTEFECDFYEVRQPNHTKIIFRKMVELNCD